jgi:DNA-binding MarR family transcriptional regulator
MNFQPLDPLLHAQPRLAIMSILVNMKQADFVFIKEKTNATAGNLSVQIDKLSSANYITVTKSFKGKRPNTTCKITKAGLKAFEQYVSNLRSYLDQ